MLLYRTPDIRFIPTGEQVAMKAAKEQALLPPELSRLQGALRPRAAILFYIPPNAQQPEKASQDSS